MTYNKRKIRLLLSGLISYATFYSGWAKFKWGLKVQKNLRESHFSRSRYCYSVWLRHLVHINKNGLSTQIKSVAELGPGTSLGVGIAALLSGVNNYFAFEIFNRTETSINIKMLHEMVKLFSSRCDIPGEKEFPRVRPLLASYKFPWYLFNLNNLDKLLNKERVKLIEESIFNLSNKSSMKKDTEGIEKNSRLLIKYFVPWHHPQIIRRESVDLILSQAVLEHVEDPLATYMACYKWLKPGGIMSHDIDFKCHGTAELWNGHWSYSDFSWSIIKGKRPYLVTNRKPLSFHIEGMKKSGFTIMSIVPTINRKGLRKQQLASGFKNISEDDLVTESAYILAIKKK
jgi:SAM-dependent methyltransferase